MYVYSISMYVFVVLISHQDMMISSNTTGRFASSSSSTTDSISSFTLALGNGGRRIMLRSATFRITKSASVESSSR